MNWIGEASKSIKKHEGLRLQIYKCTSGKSTIGYGRNLDDNGISVQEAETLLMNDVSRCISQLEMNIDFFNYLPDIAKSVLTDMCYNMGISNLMKFRKTLMYLEQNDWKSASEEMLCSKWFTQVGVRALNLSNRLASLSEK